MVPTPPGARAAAAADPASRELRILGCQIWLADLTAAQPSHWALLNEAERGRCERYRQQADRDRFILGAALLRIVAAAEMGIPPHTVRVDRTCPKCESPHGKPRVINSDLHVSVSHSGKKVALAITRAAPVGVDVERHTERDAAGLSRLVLNAAERSRGLADFYTYWCRKEAVVKATGDGLGVPLVDVVVTSPESPAGLISYLGQPLPCALSDVPVGSGYAGAVAVLAAGRLDVGLREAAGLLATT